MNAQAARLATRTSAGLFRESLLKGLLVFGTATFLVASTVAAAADSDKGARIQRLLNTPHARTALPRAKASHKRVTVVVEVAGDSVASARAVAVDHAISTEASDSIRRASAQRLASIEPLIASHGGRVLARFHDAISGVKVDIDESEIESLRGAPGVAAVRKVRTYRMNNVESVPFIGAPLVWQGSPSYRGEGRKVAIIDTGIDYTHANFAGPRHGRRVRHRGRHLDAAANPKLFGPKAPKVKGGIDLVGDDYDADSDVEENTVPKPDPNPLDCNGHGSHVAGTARGLRRCREWCDLYGSVHRGGHQAGELHHRSRRGAEG
ncbi:MAG: S8 family serine peptidase [Gammaproteobacteria bacterium]